MLALDERRSMESLFYCGTAIVAVLGLAVFAVGLIIDRLPADESSGRRGRERKCR